MGKKEMCGGVEGKGVHFFSPDVNHKNRRRKDGLFLCFFLGGEKKDKVNIVSVSS